MTTATNRYSAYLNILSIGIRRIEEAKEMTANVRDALIRRAIANAVSKTRPQMFSDLIDATTLESKDAVMRTMHIVPVPVCAAYLGVMEDDIYRFKRSAGAGFGEMYCQSLCFSLNELSYFAQNRDWFTRSNGERYMTNFSTPSVSFLMDGTFVCTSMMVGYLAVNNRTNPGDLQGRENFRREYRLSDIRKEFVMRFPLGSRPKFKAAPHSANSIKHVTGGTH